jgi:hypothetical protein
MATTALINDERSGRRASVSGALFLFLFAVYLLTYTPRINSSDGLAMFATAESLVRRGALDIEQIRWLDLQQGTYGLDGLLYSRKGVGMPLGLLPLTWLGLITPWFGTVSVSLLFNPIVTALTATLLLAYLERLGFSRRTGLAVALIFGLATLAWPYAKSLFSDPFSGLLLLAAAYALLRFYQAMAGNEAEQPGNGEVGSESLLPIPPSPHLPTSLIIQRSRISLYLFPFLAGLFLGWNVATRYAEALFLPLFGLLLLYYLAKAKAGRPGLPARAWLLSSSFWLPLVAFALPIFLVGLGLIVFNLSRYGDPLNTGYLPNETFSGVLLDGLLGQLISPGRGLFLYCPILVLSLWGVVPFFRRCRAEAGLALSIIIFHLLLYGKWFMWHGGYAWGARFMVPTLPFWAVFLAPVAARVMGEGRGFQSAMLRIVFFGLLGLSLIPQLLSVIIDFGPFQNALLETGLPLFARQTFFGPQYSPLLKAWGFIASDTLDLVWAWQGKINGWLLGVLLINVSLAGLNLKRLVSRDGGPGLSKVKRLEIGLNAANNKLLSHSPHLPISPSPHLLPYLSTLIALVFLLAYTHSLPAKPVREIVEILNQTVQPVDAVITNSPAATEAFAELYKGRASVLGLNTGSGPLPADITARLNWIMTHHRQVWWLPGELPPEKSAVEQTLLATGFRVRNDRFERQRLALFAYPEQLTIADRLTSLNFDVIRLAKVAYTSPVAAGQALPVELQWQTAAPLAEDYHVFIHLLDRQGRMVAQADGQPGQWTRPTTSWRVGETVVDRHGLWISPEMPAGYYQLRLGLYRPGDGRRLHLPDGADSVQFEIRVERGG